MLVGAAVREIVRTFREISEVFTLFFEAILMMGEAARLYGVPSIDS